ncbi:MAG: hypothetical protein KFF49_03985, partial [Bacteroidales bacterium]|nr:hypothetical protein [Bacteroidales bacterium]
MILLIFLFACPLYSQPVSLSNQYMTISFDPGDNYSVSELINKAHGVDFIKPRPSGSLNQDRSVWEIEVRSPINSGTLRAGDASGATHNFENNSLTIIWTGIRSEKIPGDLTVRAVISLPEGSSKAYFNCEVSGETTGWLWGVEFPRVYGIREFTDCWMSIPDNWGRLARKPQQHGRRGSISYPLRASMQWFSYWGVNEDRVPPLAEASGRDSETGWTPDYSDAAGLYWAAEDGEVYKKYFNWDPTHPGNQMSFSVKHIPGFDSWPMPMITAPVAVSYAMLYDVSVGVFTGDWLSAADIYHDWAKDQEWSSRGTVDAWPNDMPASGSDDLTRWTPTWFRNIGFWAKYYHEPAKILPEWGSYRKWLGVPVASHWYRYHLVDYNNNDPEYLPGDPYLLEGIRAARELGVEPMPYILSIYWDKDTQSWIHEGGEESAVRTGSGDIPPFKIDDNAFGSMCISQDQWHKKMQEVTGKLVNEYDMSGVYLDALAKADPKNCYNPAHGHSIHGGNYWGQGARELMRKLRYNIRRFTPEASFFSEGIGEHLIDLLDGFLTLDITRNYTREYEQVWPLTTGVYHPYTINFGSDAHIKLDPEQFAIIYGRQLIWGSQPLNSEYSVPDPEEGDASSEILREYTRAYYVAGQPWLMGGRMLRMAVRPKDGHVGNSGLELAADPYTVPYGGKKIWTGPSVLASAWERHGDIGIVMANVTGSTQSVDLTVRGEELGLSGEQMVRLWPEPQQMGVAAGSRSLDLEPWQCLVLCITSDTEGAIARLNKLDEMPWELKVVKDGPIPPVTGEGSYLYASSDGPVNNEPLDSGFQATIQRWDDQGNLVNREGFQASTRNFDDLPFALFRQLPHKAVTGDQGIVV